MFENMRYFEGIARRLGFLLRLAGLVLLAALGALAVVVLRKLDVEVGLALAAVVGEAIIAALALMIGAGVAVAAVAIYRAMGAVAAAPTHRSLFSRDEDLIVLAARYLNLRAQIEHSMTHMDLDFLPKQATKACLSLRRQIRNKSSQHLLADELTYGLTALVHALESNDDEYLLRAPTWEQISPLTQDYAQYHRPDSTFA